MESNLHRLINEKLAVLGRVDLPGIGSIKVSRASAKVDYHEGVIEPPEGYLEFEGNTSALDAFYFCDSEDSIYGDANNSGVYQEINRYFEKQEPYIIPEVGRLEKIGDDIIFEQDDESCHIESFRVLKPVQFVPLTSGADFVKKSTTPKRPLNGTKSSFSWKLWVALILILLNVGLLFYALNYNTFSSGSKVSVNLPEDRLNIRPMEDQVDDEVDSVTEEYSADEWDAAGEQDEEDATDAKDTQEEDTIDTSADFQSYTMPEIVEDDPVIDEAINDEYNREETGQIKNIESEALGLARLLELNTKGETCALVLGAFGNAQNITNMQQDLESKGFRVYTQEIGELTRVGVYVPCRSGSEAVSLGRQVIESGAWLLKL